MTLLAKLKWAFVFAVKRILLIGVLGVIGLVVGYGCVLLPIGVPLGIVAIAAVILLWVLPDLRVVPVRLTRLFYFVFIFSVLCIPTYFTLVFPGMPWISIRRSILLAFVVPLVVTISGSSQQRSAIMATLRSSKGLMFCCTGLFAMLVISTLLSTKVADSMNALTNDVLIWFVPLIATVMLVRDEETLLKVFKLLIFCVMFDFCIGLIETYLQRPFLFFLLPASMRDQILSANPAYGSLVVGQQIRNGLYRAESIYNISLSWGEMAAMLGPVGAYFLAHGRTRFERVYGLAGALMSLGSIVMSGSRGAYVGFIAAMAVFLLLWAVRQGRTHPESLVSGIALTLCSMFAMAVMGAIYFVGKLHRAVLGGGEVQSSNDGRWAQWALAKPKIWLSPLWGYGPGTAGDVIGFYTSGTTPTVDSYIMTSLVDTGIPGFLFFTGMLLIPIVTCLRAYMNEQTQLSAIGGTLGCSMIAYTAYRVTLSQQENMTTMFIFVGLTYAYHHLRAVSRVHVKTPTSAVVPHRRFTPSHA